MQCIIPLCVFLFSLASIKADIGKIPEKDFTKIKSFFAHLIHQHDFAYAIFGSKPMSLADICLRVLNLPIYQQLKIKFLLINIKNNLNTWYKYKDRFNLKDFVLLDKEEDLCRSVVIVLINKKNMLSVLKEHKEIFKQELGDTFTPESFLEKIETRELSLAKSINHHYGLLGIMLGYGARNAMLFQERLNVLKEMEKSKSRLSLRDDLEQKLLELDSQCQEFREFEEFPLVRPLYFRADLSHPETIELKKRYENDRQKIAELMQKPNFIEKALERLVQ